MNREVSLLLKNLATKAELLEMKYSRGDFWSNSELQNGLGELSQLISDAQQRSRTDR